MGTDIHMFLEVKSPRSKRWMRHTGEMRAWRSYNVFSKLAGVAGSGPALIAPRGLPADLSPAVRKVITRNPDFHTPTWLTASEYRKALEALPDLKDGAPAAARSDYWRILKMMEDVKTPSDVRIIICFDC